MQGSDTKALERQFVVVCSKSGEALSAERKSVRPGRVNANNFPGGDLFSSIFG
jgi:hypothetical protein